MDGENNCKAGIIKSHTLHECSNELLKPKGVEFSLVGKIPVVLAEPVIQVDVESVIRLEEPAFEIKRIKKNVFITQCKLIDTGCGKSGKLFLSGFVRKNIEFATADCRNKHTKSVSGKILHTTVNVPFSCVTKVYFETPPQLSKKGNIEETASFFREIKGDEFCGQEIIGNDPCEQAFEHIEFFNERIFCELVEAKIFEDDVVKERKPFECECNNEDFIFDEIVEKMVIFVRLKILQKQQVHISGSNQSVEVKNKY